MPPLKEEVAKMENPAELEEEEEEEEEEEDEEEDSFCPQVKKLKESSSN